MFVCLALSTSAHGTNSRPLFAYVCMWMCVCVRERESECVSLCVYVLSNSRLLFAYVCVVSISTCAWQHICMHVSEHIQHIPYFQQHLKPINTYIHAYMHTYIHAYMHACIHSFIHAYIHMYFKQNYPHKKKTSKTKIHKCRQCTRLEWSVCRPWGISGAHTCIHTYMQAYKCLQVPSPRCLWHVFQHFPSRHRRESRRGNCCCRYKSPLHLVSQSVVLVSMSFLQQRIFSVLVPSRCVLFLFPRSYAVDARNFSRLALTPRAYCVGFLSSIHCTITCCLAFCAPFQDAKGALF